jgi:hypothetical protein
MAVPFTLWQWKWNRLTLRNKFSTTDKQAWNNNPEEAGEE